MKSLLVTLCIFFTGMHVFAQVSTFEKNIGNSTDDNFQCIIKTLDNNYLAAGFLDVEQVGYPDFYMVKLNENGDTLWSKTYSTASGDDAIKTVVQLPDSGYVCMGNSWSGNRDIILFRTDKKGELIWSKRYGKNADDIGSHMVVNGNNILIAGFTKSIGGADRNMLLINTNMYGDTLWTKAISTDSVDMLNSLLVFSPNEIYIAGQTWGLGKGEGDCYLAKMDSTGNIVWQKLYGGRWDETILSLAKTASGDLLLGGNTESWTHGVLTDTTQHPAFNKQDALLIKTNATGDTLWTKTYGGQNFETIFQVKELENTIGFVGRTSSFGVSSSVYYSLLNTTGDTLWSKIVDGNLPEYGYEFEQNTNKGFTIAGYTKSITHGGFDCYLIKTDAYGNSGCNSKHAATAVGGTRVTVQTINSGFTFHSGLNVSDANLVAHPDSARINEICACSVSASISLTDSACINDTVLVLATGGTSFNWNTGSANDSIYVYFSTDTLLSVVVTNGSCSVSDSVFIQTVVCNGLPDSFAFNTQNKIYPNPCMYPCYPDISSKEYFIVYNSLGEKMKVINQDDFKILPRGIYFIRDTHSTQKLIIE